MTDSMSTHFAQISHVRLEKVFDLVLFFVV
jgi:hypothetical protein